MRVVLAFVGCAGCTQVFGLDNPARAPRTDAAPMTDSQAQGDAPSVCLGSGTFRVCLDQEPTNAVVTTQGILDTTSSMLCLASQPTGWLAAGQPEACFVVGTSVSIPQLLIVTGARPLVIVATGAITVDMALDVSSRRTTSTGPGVATSPCPVSTDLPSNNSDGAGGGAGASFLTAGGNGGDGNSDPATGGTAPPPLATAPTVLRAGCRGQAGGLALGGGFATGGAGGGALYLVAGTSITLAATAQVVAVGAGAEAAPGRSGGGAGGGSGGMIVLHAPTIMVAVGARIWANGGGGSSGANDTGSGSSAPGGESIAPASVAAGGSTNADGGEGFALGSPAMNGANGGSFYGGGGGGGGAGYIQANMALTNATVSPTPVILAP